ncbi:MAG: DUF6624 domain-containing protein [Gemmatimonadales bacterium]
MKVAAMVTALATAALASSLSAQARGAPRCTMPDTTKEWFAQQRTWLDDSKHDWTNDSLRQVLVRAAGVDASRPLPVQQGWTRLDASGPKDSATIAMLRGMMRQRGSPFPTRSVVGAAGVRAVWLLTLGDSALEASVLRRMMEAGLGESFEADVAVLEDRVRVRAGRAQLYGTVQRAVTGTAALARIEDSTHVDLRRDAAGMPPLVQARCAAQTSPTRP